MARLATVTALAVLLLAAGPALASSTCAPDGVQASGSIYRICMPAPEDYNGRLVLWAHGFQDAGTPVQIPEGQLAVGDISLPTLINDLGFAFATNSYSKTGLAIRQGMADLLDLVEIFEATHGAPEKIYLTGASAGGIITTLLVENHPEVFDAGVAACGPVGDFAYQINYFGNARATFEYFFPGLIPGDPFSPPADLVAQWGDYYRDIVRPEVFAPQNAARLTQWARVARLPFDRNDREATLELSVRDVLRYSVVNLTDASETLGGFPFDNTRTFYLGSYNDLRLNINVQRVAADPAALEEMDLHYDTSGDLDAPLVTLHTRLDQQVPYFHETLYTFKTLTSGSFLRRHVNLPIDRFGHCEFRIEEAVAALAIALVYAGDGALLPDLLDQLPAAQAATVEAFAATAAEGDDPGRLLRAPAAVTRERTGR